MSIASNAADVGNDLDTEPCDATVSFLDGL
jgi:hypothetical protein